MTRESEPAPLNWLGCAVLFLAALFTHRGVLECGFVNFDDPAYVQNNPIVHQGLRGLPDAFSQIHAGYWIPLTWVSYQIDHELNDINPAGYHRTNLLLHALSSVILFLALARLTGRELPAFLTAALFALHPVQVESVAWVTERKDVLSTLFWNLALLAWARYCERPGPGRYLAVLACLGLGLMAKPMLVTLPCLLLLLDWWPLKRWQDGRTFRRCLLEKLPLFALALAAGMLTIIAQDQGTAVRSLDQFSPLARVLNLLVSYPQYIGSLLWPVGLAVFYPHPGEAIPAWQWLGSLVFLGLATLVLWRGRERAPWALVGWLWFLGVLFPVSGVLQVGWQGRADRFLYVPAVGLFLAFVWAIVDLVPQRGRRWVLGGMGLTLGLLAILSSRQVLIWKDSLTLWRHAQAVVPENFVALDCLAAALLDAGQADAAIPLLERAHVLRPDHELSLYLLGSAHEQRGNRDGARKCWEQALTVNQRCAAGHARLGKLLAEEGQFGEAERHTGEALRLDGRSALAWEALGTLRQRQGRLAEAAEAWRQAAALSPHAPREKINPPRNGEGEKNRREVNANIPVPGWFLPFLPSLQRVGERGDRSVRAARP